MKIGFLDRTQANWTAGASYTRSMVRALAGADKAGGELCVLSGRRSSFAELPSGVGAIRIDSEAPSILDVKLATEAHGLDVLLPVTEALLPETPAALIGWIPDFQHRRLPEFFTEEELKQRDRYFGYLVSNCDGMMFSSEAVRADFHEFYPDFSGLSTCAHFPSSFAYEDELVIGDPRPVREKYRLPSGFVLVANQFWKHKNHGLVVEAVARACREQPAIHVVMVGVPTDSRDPRSAHLSELFRRLSVERLFPHISVLGEVPLADLVALMRCALEVVQPSRFEGWNTTVEDALALGKCVACSDLAVHREQAPAAFFFPADDAAPLARHFATLDWLRAGWAGEASERAALQAERTRSVTWAGELIEFCRRVTEARRQRGGERAGWVGHDPEEEFRRHPLLYIEGLERQNEELVARRKVESERARNDRQAATAERRVLREKLAQEKKKNEALTQELWRERAKPLRQRVSEELSRRIGRTISARPKTEN
jgi:glycosyltransferase involved in cell wall biosynthesis